MNDSITHSQLHSHLKRILSEPSSDSNQTSTTAKSTPIFDDFEQFEDADKIQSSKEDFIQKFFQQRDYVIKKMAQICQIENQPKRITELRRLIFLKSLMQEAIEVRNLLKDKASRQVLQELTSDIELSLQCLHNLKDFYQTQNSLPQAEKMRKTSHMIESTWQQIYKLPIYDPLLINEVSKLEWIFRAIEVLSHNRADSQYPYIEYCKLLKQGALESQSEEIMESKFYKRIEEELHIQRSLLGKVSFLFEQERKGAPAKQEQKMDVEEAKKLLQELKQFGFGIKQEVDYVEGIVKKALGVEKEFLEFLEKKDSASPNDLFKLTRQIRSFPVKFLRIEENLNKLFNDQNGQIKNVLQDTSRRIVEKNRELYIEFLRYFEVNTVKDASAEERLKAYKQEIQRRIRYSVELIQGLENLKFEDLGIISQQMPVKGYKHIKAELWLARMRILGIFCESIIKPVKITFEKLRSFLTEIKDYIESLPNSKRIPFDEQLAFVHGLFQQTKVWIRIEREKQEKTGKTISDKVFYGFIDVTKEIMKPTKKQRRMDSTLYSKGSQIKEIESLNKKRSRIDNRQIQEIIDSYEKIEKKMKKHNEEKQDNRQNCLQKTSKRKQDKITESHKVDERKIDNRATSEEFKEAEELLNELSQEMLFDESFVLENNVFGMSYLDGTSYLDRLNDEFWNDVDNEFKIKKEEKDNLANAQVCNFMA